MKQVTVYTDGACSGNPGPGGWGAILEYRGTEKELFGAEPETTNNRMELMAVIVALETLKEPCRVDLYSDSKYVIDALEKGWAVRWRKNGWMRNKKDPALNPELWEQLLSLMEGQDIQFYLVKGHVDVNKGKGTLQKRYAQFLKNNGPDFSYDDFLYATKMNNRADELANLGMKPYKKQTRSAH